MNRMGWGSARTSANRNSLLLMVLNARTFSSMAEAPTLYVFLKARTKAHEAPVCKADSRRLSRGSAGRALCHFVREQVFSGVFEQAICCHECAGMTAGYCVMVHARLCSVQRLLPHRKCAKCKKRPSCVLKTPLNLAAAALCIDWRVGGGYMGLI